MMVLMISELITGIYAVEATMTLTLNESSNIIDETLSTEIAITNAIDQTSNEVVKIPGSLLKHPGVITDVNLPVDVEVLHYWKNSNLESRGGPPPDESWTFLPSLHSSFRLAERPESAGVDQDQHGDAVAVRVNVRKKGTEESLGRFTLSIWFYPNSTFNPRNIIYPPFTFTVDGRPYTIELRNKRDYLPYSLHLKKFEHSKYEGTNTNKDFASTVDVIDPAEGEGREAHIWMNNPLRYKGQSFYQYMVVGQDAGTVLQVVHNPGRLLPYIACAMVSLGMMLHFGLHLNVFLKRKKKRKAEIRESSANVGYERYLPIAVVALAALWLLSKALMPSTEVGQMDYEGFAELPVMHNGRLKPIDTVARTTLQAISSRSEVQDENKKTVATAIQWYIDVFDSPSPFVGKASEYKVFRIDNDQVLTLMKLQPRPEFFRYSLADLNPHIQVFEAERNKLRDKDSKKFDKRDSKVLDLGKKLNLYEEMLEGKTPQLIAPQKEGEEWQSLFTIDGQIQNTQQERDAAFDEAKADIMELLEQGTLRKGIKPEELQAFLNRRMEHILRQDTSKHRDRVSVQAAKFTELMHLAKERKAFEFNEALATYRNDYLGRITTEQKWDMKFETFLNHFSPFYLCSFLYVFVIILACLSWLIWREPLNQSAFALAVFTVALHSAALLARIYLQGRPPVTNLYSSAIFIGWGGVVLCLALERVYRNGMGNVLAGGMGALTMMMAHYLAESGDTMEMLQAVLDTNFWLATHVTIVTMGYMATFVAGGIGLFYIAGGIFTKAVDSEVNKVFGQMLYGVICFATLLSFTGTVLGGLWADYSWGRFWGWDSKENGAVMVVIWNTLILHARWAGLIKLRGIAVLALVGNMITFWSWFGTNQLGAGLHAYGFNTELAERCRYFWLIHLALISVGLLPQKYWRSFSEETLRQRAENARSNRRI